jgi:hypothetical protein
LTPFSGYWEKIEKLPEFECNLITPFQRPSWAFGITRSIAFQVRYNLPQ